MLDVLNLALPYFGLVFAGLIAGRLTGLTEQGLAGLSVLVLYVALPALFYRILAQTPFEQLTNAPFILAATGATFLVLALSFGLALALRRSADEAAIAALAGAYGNIGYMGPGLALATLGPAATAPVALIFCFETLLFFSLAPLVIALARPSGEGIGPAMVDVARRIALNPLMIATALGALSAALHVEPPVAIDRLLSFLQNAAAPGALFLLGATVAQRPLGRVPADVGILCGVKLVLHPLVMLGVLWLAGPFDPIWTAAAVLMASLPPALNVFVLARQYHAWIEPASTAVLIGTLASVGTLTAAMVMVQQGLLPALR